MISRHLKLLYSRQCTLGGKINETEQSPEIDPNLNGQPIFNKGAKAIQCRTDSDLPILN